MAQQGRQKLGRDGLTVKQRKWLKVYLETGNATEAAMQAYDCKDRESASALGAENLRKLRGPVRDLMEARGLTVGRLLAVLGGGLDAERVEVAKFQGAISGEKSYRDWPTRHRYLDTAMKLLGLYAPEKHEVTGKDGGPLQAFFEKTDKELEGIIDGDRDDASSEA